MSKRFLAGAIITVLAVGSLLIAFTVREKHGGQSVTTTQEEFREFALKLGRTNAPAQSALVAVPLSHPIRLAIGGLGLTNDNQNQELEDLVLTALTGARGIELVERQSLETVLKEMNLSVSGLVRANEAVRVGKIVRADWFLLGTPTSLQGTNFIVVRLVDARTGVMLNGAVFLQKTVPALAGELADFIRQSRQAAAEARPRVYLAIGAFDDLGVNNRLAAFPTQLRGYLTAAYQHSQVTLLEREYVDILQQEMRLDLAGSTEGGGTNPPVPMQSAFWLVDGYYQSFESSNFEVEINLNIKQVFGYHIAAWKKPIVLRAKPGKPIFKKIKAAIDREISKKIDVLAPTRFSEADAQMDMGRTLTRPVIGMVMGPVNWNLAWPQYNYELDDQAATKQHRNVVEAIRAFQTVLLLEPDNYEAKIYLAVLLRSPFIGNMDEARNYYREIIEDNRKDQWTDLAKRALDASFENDSPEEKIRWFAAASEHGTNSSADEYFRQEAASARTTAVLHNGGSKAQEIVEARLLENITNAWINESGGDEVAEIDDFVATFGTNQAAAAQRLNELYPKLKTQAPGLAPYLLAQFVTVQTDTNAPLVVEFRRMLEQLVQHPDQVYRPDKFWRHIWPAYEWCCDHKLYGMAANLLEEKLHAVALCPKQALEINNNDINDDKLGLAFAYLGAQQWGKALKIFETYSNQPVRMWQNGPWGHMFSMVLTAKYTDYCRRKLGLSKIADSREFNLGKPVLCLGTPSTISSDSSGIWIGIAGQLLHLDFDLRTNLIVHLPMNDYAPITALCLAPSSIWIATAGDGLIEFDKASHKCRRYTEKDGLMMDSVASLCLAGKTLWIGYGKQTYGIIGSSEEQPGGLGKYDLTTGRFASFMPSLSGMEYGGDNRPTRRSVTKLAASPAGDIWFLTDEVDPSPYLHRYQPDNDSWKVFQNDCSALAGSSKQMALAEDITQRLSIFNFETGQWRNLAAAGQLPSRVVSTLTLNGNSLWVGGPGYIALIDTVQDKLLHFAYINAKSVDSIQVGGGYVWAKFDWHLYRVPLSALR